MNAEQIESAYQEAVKKITLILDEDRKKNDDLDREVEKLTAQRQLERKIYWKQKEEKAQRDNKEVLDIMKDGGEV